MKILRFLYIVWATLVFTVVMIVILPFVIIPTFFGHQAMVITFFFLKLWSWLFSKLNFIRYHISGTSNLKGTAAGIYVSNHTSFLDLPGLCLAIPGQFRPLAKKELLRIPIFGWIVSAATIVVDRSSPESRNKSLFQLKRLLQWGVPVLIFPEGTQNRSTDILQPFKDGAFRIALETQIPIIPVAIQGAGKLMPPGKFSIQPGQIKINFGKPIWPKEYQQMNVKELKDFTFDRLYSMLQTN